MDIRKWVSPCRWRCIHLLFLAICLLRLEYATASESGYASQLENQESNEEDTSGNKLDSLNSLLPFDLEQDSEYKRGSSFFPLRGKKLSLDDAIAAHQELMSDQQDKRSQFYPLRGKKIPLELKRASYFMPMRGRKDEGWMPDDIPEDKRASSFMPMRGKKSSGDSTYQHLGKSGMYSSDVTEVLYPSSSYNNQIPGKRASSFLPVRGRRSENDAPKPLQNEDIDPVEKEGNGTSQQDAPKDHVIQKRSVSFMPMRGRSIFSQETSNSLGPGEITTSLLDKKQYSFMPMRGRKFFPSAINDSSLDVPTVIFPADKKASSFMPMRGRRIFEQEDEQPNSLPSIAHDVPEPVSDKEYADYSSEKRASSFMPMRGRRISLDEVPNSGFMEWSEDSDDLKEAKKSSSFMPMRGRRVEDHRENKSFSISDGRSSQTDIKRSSFMPMRGRRISEDLLGVDDKRKSSFMPMRGRRISLDEVPSSGFMEWTENSDGLEETKKAASFMPMRGRRVDDDPENESSSISDGRSSQTDVKRLSFMPMRGRRISEDLLDIDDKRKSSFLPMRGRRRKFSDVSDSHSYYNPYPYFMAGIGSSLMSRPYRNRRVTVSSIRDLADKKRRLKINWDSVKRAFHATRGKRFNKVDDFVNELKENYIYGSQDFTNEETDNSQDKHSRMKRNVVQPRVSLQPQGQYIALKRPMSFFATRGKRLDDSIVGRMSKLH